MSVPAFWDEAKQYVDLISNLLAEAGEVGQIPADVAKKGVKGELLNFMMYLSASDGTISTDEAAFITYVLGMSNVSVHQAVSHIASTIRENNIYSKEYETKVPTSLQLAVTVDNLMIDAGAAIDSSITQLLLQAYEKIGMYIIQSDNNVDANEVKDFKIYMKTMQDYADANYKGILSTNSNANSSNATGFVKQ